MSDLCPCGSAKNYADCCQIFHKGTLAPTPEALMRSRYSAFVKSEIDYLVATANPDQGTAEARDSLAQTLANTDWLALKILSTAAGADDNEGFVEFVAFFRGKNQNRTGQLREKSRFIRQGESWIYWDGTILPVLNFGRNDACWCGSGQKLKKCHPN